MSIELPRGWALAKIPDLIGSNGVFSDGDWVESEDQDPNGDVRLIQLADVGDGAYINKSNRFLTKSRARELNCTFLRTGDVLVARMPDPLGRACIFPGDKKDAVTVVDVCVIRSEADHIDHQWLMHFINSPALRADIHALQSGSTRKRISRGNLSTIPVPVPPRAEQTRIVEKLEELLSDLDAGVAELKAAQRKLAQYRQSLLKAAVEGALTAQWRRNDFSAGERPTGWTPVTLSDVADWSSGGTPSRSNPSFFLGAIPWIKTGELGPKVIGATEEHISEEAIASSSAKVFPKGAVALAMYGATIGKASILGVDAATNQACAVGVPKAVVCTEFLYYYLLSQAKAFAAAGKGGAQPNISQGIVKSWPLLLPPLDEQREIVAVLEALLEAAKQQQIAGERGLGQATAQRQNLLKAAFAGRLVPQDPNDEPASELLARIRAERASNDNAPRRRRKTA